MDNFSEVLNAVTKEFELSEADVAILEELIQLSKEIEKLMKEIAGDRENTMEVFKEIIRALQKREESLRYTNLFASAPERVKYAKARFDQSYRKHFKP